MKHLLAAFIFLVTWQENELRSVGDKDGFAVYPPIYTVEPVNNFIKLKTSKDVDLFLGQEFTAQSHLNPHLFYKFRVNSVISDKAFNIDVKKIK